MSLRVFFSVNMCFQITLAGFSVSGTGESPICIYNLLLSHPLSAPLLLTVNSPWLGLSISSL